MIVATDLLELLLCQLLISSADPHYLLPSQAAVFIRYVIQTSSVKSLWDMGLELFKSHLVPCTEVITKLSAGLLHSIEV